MQEVNLVYICHFKPINPGNFVASMNELATEITKRGIGKITYVLPIVARDRKWVKTLSACDIYYSEFDLSSMYRTLQMIGCNNGKRTIIHTHFVGSKVILAIKLAFARRDYKVLFHMHNHVNLSHNSIKSFVRQLLYRRVDFIGVSNAVYEDLLITYPRESSYQVNNAIVFTNLDYEKSEYEFENDKFNILVIGSEFYRKGIDLVICALEQMKEYSCCLYIVSNNKEVIEELIGKTIGGEIPRYIRVISPVDKVKMLFDQADLFISASRSDSFCYAVAEAAYSDCQVLASDVRGQNTMKVVEHINWFESESVQSLMDEIKIIIKRVQNHTEIKQYNIEQKNSVVREFEIKNWVEQIIDIYKIHSLDID
ncbi:MAG: glycosyltransferase family 4 protein [Eubacteriales bacterium]